MSIHQVWNGEGSLDGTANNTIQAEQLYKEIARFEGKSLLEGDIVANTEREAFSYREQPVQPSFNVDWKMIETRPNQPATVIVDFKNVEGTFGILVTDKQRMKYRPNMKTSTTPLF